MERQGQKQDRAGRFRRLVLINGFIFVRTIFLMTALALIMRESARFGETGMAASHVVNQYLMLIALGLDGFAHAAEALAGAAGHALTGGRHRGSGRRGRAAGHHPEGSEAGGDGGRPRRAAHRHRG